MGYHTRKIEKGVLGESSKIREELDELIDAEETANPIMALVELSDICGAIELYLKNKFPSVTIEDLFVMARATSSAFQDGTRESKKKQE